LNYFGSTKWYVISLFISVKLKSVFVVKHRIAVSSKTVNLIVVVSTQVFMLTIIDFSILLSMFVIYCRILLDILVLGSLAVALDILVYNDACGWFSSHMIFMAFDAASMGGHSSANKFCVIG
jgi:hypothetical protein